MYPPGTSLLLISPTTTLGRELLLRLTFVGFEVTAYVPAGDAGRTGEFACRLAHDANACSAAESSAGVVVEAAAEDGRSVLVRRAGDDVRRFPHPPLIGDVVERVRRARWLDLLRDPWHGLALPVVHEREVAQAVVDALLRDQPGTELGGPEALTWRAVSVAVLSADGRSFPWRLLAGRWPEPGDPDPSLAAMACCSRVGRRTLADTLRRRDTAVPRPAANDATGAVSIP